MRKRLGLDIDGVIADSQTVIIECLNQYFNKNYQKSDFINFDPLKMFGVDRDTVDRLIMKRELDIIERSQPIAGAAEIIRQLHSEFSIHLISARTVSYFNHTVEWLDKNDINYDNLILLGHHDKRHSCIDENVCLFVEDNKKNAHQIISCGIPVYLFDAAYNQGALPGSIRRVYSWAELLNHIMTDFEHAGPGTNG